MLSLVVFRDVHVSWKKQKDSPTIAELSHLNNAPIQSDVKAICCTGLYVQALQQLKHLPQKPWPASSMKQTGPQSRLTAPKCIVGGPWQKCSLTWKYEQSLAFIWTEAHVSKHDDLYNPVISTAYERAVRIYWTRRKCLFTLSLNPEQHSHSAYSAVTHDHANYYCPIGPNFV